MTDEALLAVLRSSQRREVRVSGERARYRAAWLSARRRAQSWRSLYIEATAVAGRGRPVVDRALYEKDVLLVHKENRRARNRIAELENELHDLKLAHSELQGSLGRRT